MTTAETVGNYLNLAEAAEAAENHEEAYQYFTRALEADPRNARAWLGKGTAAGWGSNLRTDRLKEAIAGMQRAIQMDAGLNAKAARALTDILESYYALSDTHTREFVAVDGTFSEHVERCNSILASARQVHEWDPRARPALDLVVSITDVLFEAMLHGFENERVLGPDKYPEFLEAEKDWAVGKIKELDPTYKETKVGLGGGCLVWSIALAVILLGGVGVLMFLAKMSKGE